MKSKLLKNLALVFLVAGVGGCNMGPGPDTEADVETGMEMEVDQREDALGEVAYDEDGPSCLVYRRYYRMECVNGVRHIDEDSVGYRWIGCGLTSYLYGTATNCYSDNIYQCFNNPDQECSGNRFVCPFCLHRPTIDPVDQFAF